MNTRDGIGLLQVFCVTSGLCGRELIMLIHQVKKIFWFSDDLITKIKISSDEKLKEVHKLSLDKQMYDLPCFVAGICLWWVMLNIIVFFRRRYHVIAILCIGPRILD